MKERHLRPALSARLALLALSGLALLPGSLHAAQADRARPLIVDAGNGFIDRDPAKGRFSVNGPVTVTKGSMLLRAASLVGTELADGYLINVKGEAEQPVRFSQALDAPGETMEAWADTLEYDERSGQAVLSGNARLRILAGGQEKSELRAERIRYNAQTGVAQAEGKADAVRSGEGGLRMILAPKGATAAASAPPAGLPLQTAPALTPKPPSR